MSHIAVCPGSFDPPTLGHLDVIAKAAALFDELFVAVVHNPAKRAMLSTDLRAELLRQAIAEAGIAEKYPCRIVVDVVPGGLLVEYAGRVGAGFLVKGLRNTVDVAYEAPMAIVNRDLGKVETVFLMPDPSYAHVSSSLIKQVFGLGGDVSKYVPAVVAEALQPTEG